MSQLKIIALLPLSLACLLPAGCGCLLPLKVQSCMAIRNPIKVDTTMNTLPDQGPLLEVAVPPVCRCSPTNKVAVIDVDGLLLNSNPVGPYSMGENPVPVFQEKLMAAAWDPAVKAVVLRINSPGGSVAATEIMGQMLLEFRSQTGKPVVASLLDLGTGGGYYLASCCDAILALPASVVGGVGVILNLYFLELSMEQWNAFGNPIKAGDRVDMGTPTRKMTAEEKAMLTTMAREYQANFKRVVLRGRPQVRPNSAVFDGRVLAASQAMEAGLIDGVGFVPDAIALASQLAGAKMATAVMYRRCGSPARSLYETVPNKPAPTLDLPWSVPGPDRSRLPLFLYLWAVEPTMPRIAGG